MIRCPRCHHAPSPNPNGCALCNPEELGVRLKEALAALESARAELAQRSGIFTNEQFAAMAARSDGLTRALAMEEFLERWKTGASSRGAFPAEIRALAPLPASLVAVPREVMEKVREALEACIQDWVEEDYNDATLALPRAALALLGEVSK